MGLETSINIKIDGKDLDKRALSLISEIEICDEVGILADSCQIVFNDYQNILEIPERGKLLTIYIGADGNSYEFGSYHIDDVDFDPETLTIGAKGFDTSNELKCAKTRDFESKNLYEIIKTIALGHDLRPCISEEYRSINLSKKCVQVRESDLMLLAKLAKRYGASFKVNGRNLVFVTKAAKKNASGKKIDPIDIDVTQIRNWKYKINGRSNYGSVIVSYVDTLSGEIEKIEVKNTEKAKKREKRKIGTVVIEDDELERRKLKQAPPLRITLPVATRQEAIEQGKNILNAKNFERESLIIDIEGDPRYIAEGVLNIKNIRDKIDGSWCIVRARHLISDEWNTQIECQKYLEDME